MSDQPMMPETQQRGGSKAKWVLLIVAAVILIGAAIAFKLKISVLTPPGAREAARAFLDKMIAGDNAGARAMCTGDVDLGSLDRRIAEFKEWGPVRNIGSFVGREVTGADGRPRVDFDADIDFTSGLKKGYNVTVVQDESGVYRVTAYSIPQ